MITSQLVRMQVGYIVPEQKQHKKNGELREPSLVGKVHFAVFDPSGRTVVGFMVSLPDVAGMIKRADRFVARDALIASNGMLLAPDNKDSWDKGAAKRLGINLDDCLLWTGMDVVTLSGKSIGYCSDATFDFATGVVSSFKITEGATAEAIIGTISMPAEYLKGYSQQCMLVSDEAASLALSGGAAARAAEATAVAGHVGKKVGKKVAVQAKKTTKAIDETAAEAVNAGSKALGRQLKKTRGMFSAFADEYHKASGTSSKKKS